MHPQVIWDQDEQATFQRDQEPAQEEEGRWSGSNGQAGPKAEGGCRGLSGPPPKVVPTSEGDLLEALEAMKPLVASLGADNVKKIVDLLS